MKTIKTNGLGIKIAIVGLLHGNERLGLHVINLLRRDFFNANLIFIIANEDAEKASKRYIELDLNRSFPGKLNGFYEEKLAFQILKELKNCDYVVDIHSTTAKTEGFVITTKQDEKTLNLINSISLSKVVYMSHSIASGKALIDYVSCGVSLEFNEDNSVEMVYSIVKSAIESLINSEKSKNKQEFFEVYAVLERSGKSMNNFEKIKLDDEEFYPVLFGEKAYSFACLKAKKIN